VSSRGSTHTWRINDTRQEEQEEEEEEEEEWVAIVLNAFFSLMSSADFAICPHCS
jgi:hypothetical protein